MIGSDFEVFMRNTKGHPLPVPNHLDIGSKNGQHVHLSGGTMHRDNVMVELCPDPSDDAEELATRCQSLLVQASEYMSCMMEEEVTLACEPTVTFETEALRGRYAQEIGCDRDYLAQAGDVISRLPLNAVALGNVRCGAGHIHISYGVTNKVPVPMAVALCDVLLGALEITGGKQGSRRKFYGMHGLYRPKTYGNVLGVEYRTTSNLWLRSHTSSLRMLTNARAVEHLLVHGDTDQLHAGLHACYPLVHGDSLMETEDPEKAQVILQLARDIFSDVEIYTHLTGD